MKAGRFWGYDVAKITNVIETPVGRFTRKSDTAYAFAAVVEAAENPEQGLRVVGNRKGDIVHRGTYTRDNGSVVNYEEQRNRYVTVWSRTEAGARKNAEGYCWAKARIVGVFPVGVKS